MTRITLGIAAVAALVTTAHAQMAVPEGPYLQRYESEDWTLRVHINIRAFFDVHPDAGVTKDHWKFDTTAVVFPILQSTASSMTYESATGELRLNDRPAGVRTELVPGYPAGTRLGRWGFTDWVGEELELRVEIPVTCWNTKFDEEAALQVGWPTGEWPTDAASTFKPEWFIDMAPGGKPYDMTPVHDLLKRWTSGRDPKSISPVQLAKWLAGRVQEQVQPSGRGLMAGRSGALEGLELQGPPETARRMRGSEFDVVSLLTAVYRSAGLPARTVIGWDIGEEKDKRKFLERRGSAQLRAWVEFYLYDEAKGVGNWIPVDVLRLRQSSSRARPLDQAWKHFGTSDELSGVIPFAFQFHPPTTVRAYGHPGFWGWFVTPQPPDRAFQSLMFTAFSSPTSLELQKQREEELKRRGR